MSVRVQAILVLLAGLALSAFAFTLLAAWAINSFQRQLQREVEAEAQAQATRFAKELEEEARQRGIDLASQEGRQLIGKHVAPILQSQKDILLIAFKGLTQSPRTLIFTNEGGAIKAFETNTADLDRAMDVKSWPIYRRDQEKALMMYLLNTERIVERVRAASLQIRRSLASLSIVMLTLFVATCFLLWKVFKRHLRLERRNAKLGQMAYVGTLAGGLAHEIRNPLHAMNLNLQVAQEEIDNPREDSPELIRSILARARAEVGELNQSVTRFLEFARPERRAPEKTDMRELLADVLQSVKPGLEAMGGRLCLKIDPAFGAGEDASGASLSDAVSAMIQVGPMRQALLNIATNCVQAMEAKKQDPATAPDYEPFLIARVAPANSGRALQLIIQDNGPGIPRDNLRKIFDVFFSTRPGGSGFGLAIARRAFADHGGDLWAESKLGQGAAFKMILPRRLEAK
jgi:signal transduction histidine kinase